MRPNNELYQKLLCDQPLSIEEEAKLDGLLHATENARQVVRSLPEEVPSLAWRSALNERLGREASRRSRPSRWWWVGTTAAALASSLTLIFFWVTSGHDSENVSNLTSSGNLEAQLVVAHLEAEHASEISLVGLEVAPTEPFEDATELEQTELGSTL